MAAKGLILAARFLFIDMPALNMIFRGGIIPLYRHVVNMNFDIDQCATG